MAIKISGSTIIDDSRVVVNADKIGIGTPSPNRDLEILSTNATGIGVSAANLQTTDVNKAISVFNAGITSTFAVSYTGIVTANEYFGTFKGTIDTDVALENANKIQIHHNSTNDFFNVPFFSRGLGNDTYQDIQYDSSNSLEYNPSLGNLRITSGAGNTGLILKTTNNFYNRAISFQNAANAYVGALGFVDRGNNQADLFFLTGNANNDIETVGETMRLTKESTVGIGTTRPDGKLHVFDGDAIVTGGNVGIGTTIATQKLHIEHDSFHQILLKRVGAFPSEAIFSNSGSYTNISNNSTGIKFLTGATPTSKMVIRGSNVGIGTENPQALLHLQGTGGNTSGLYFKNGPYDVVRQYFSDANDNSDFVITYDGTGGAELTLHADGNLGLNESNGDDVLIGTDSVIDNSKLTIVKAAAGLTTAIALHNAAGDGNGSKIISTKSLVLSADYDNNHGSSEKSYLGFETDGFEQVRITSIGRVGIGTTDPDRILHINDSTPSIKLTDSDSSFSSEIHGSGGNLTIDTHNSDRDIVFRGGGSANEVARITGDGNVGIGTNIPRGALHVITSEQNAGILSSTNDGANLDLYDNDTQSRIRTVDGRLHFIADLNQNVNNSEIRFYVDNSLKLDINGDGDLLPGGSGQDLGASGNRWDKLYVNQIITDEFVADTDTTTGNLLVTGIATFQGNVSIAGTLTYEDVTNVDSIGLITARNGIHVTGAGVSVAGISTFINNVEFRDKIGIGTDSPDEKLHVASDITSAVVAKFERTHHNNAVIEYKNSTSRMYAGLAGDALGFGVGTSQNLANQVNNKFIVRRDTGNVGIGTIHPNQKLHIQADNPVLALESNTTTGNTNIIFGDSGGHSQGRIEYHNDGDFMRFFTNGNNERLRINSVGITSVQGQDDQDNFIVDVSGTEFAVHTDASDGEISLRAQDRAGFTNPKFMTFYTQESGSASAERLRIQSDGNVGIGTSNTPAKLEIVGNTIIGTADKTNLSNTLDVNEVLDITGFRPLNIIDDNAVIKVSRTNNVYGPGVDFQHWNPDISTMYGRGIVGIESSGMYLMNTTEEGYLHFNTTQSGEIHREVVRITSEGKVGIGTTIPSGLLHLYGSSPKLYFTDSDTNVESHIDHDSSSGNFAINIDPDNNAPGSNSNFIVRFHGTGQGGGGGDKFIVHESGNVGIGTVDPTGTNALSNNNSTLAVGIVTANQIYGNVIGGLSPTGDVFISGKLDVDGQTELDHLNVSGVSTFVGIAEFNDKVSIKAGAAPSDVLTIADPGSGNVVSLRIVDPTASTYGAHFSFYDTENEVRIGGIVDNSKRAAIAIHREAPSDVLAVTSSGRVGIGTTLTTGATRLSVYRNDTSVGNIVNIEQDGTGDAVLGFAIKGTAAWQFGIDNSDSDKFKISYDGSGLDSSTSVTLDRSGNIGIGTADPQEKLHIHEGNIIIGQDSGSNTGIRNYIKFGRVSAPKAAIGFENTTGNSRGDLIFMNSNVSNTSEFTDDDEVLRITREGNVGIGTDNPTGTNALTNNNSKLAVGIVTANEVYGLFKGTIDGDVSIENANKVQITDDPSGTGTHYIHFGNATSGYDGVEVDSDLLIFKDGNVGVGTIDPVGVNAVSGNTSTLAVGVITAKSGNIKDELVVLGKVGIGTSGSTHQLHVTQDAFINRDLILEDTSDKIIKMRGSGGNLDIFADGTIDFIESDNDKVMVTFDINTTHNDARIILEGDVDTFFNHPDHNQLGLAAGGSEIIRITSDTVGIGSTVPNIKLGIGTANPLSELHIFGETFTDITVGTARVTGNIGGINFRKGEGATGILTAQYFATTGGGHIFHSRGTQTVGFTSTGEVNIGGDYSQSDQKLKVTGNAEITGDLTVGGALTYEDVTNIDAIGVITARSGIHVGMGISVVGLSTFQNNLNVVGNLDVDGTTTVDGLTSSEDMTISKAGDAVFTVQTSELSGEDATIRIRGARTSCNFCDIATLQFDNKTNSAYTLAEIVAMDPAGSHTQGKGKLVFRTATGGNLSTSMTIREDGDVGIGTDAPSYKLHVQGSMASYHDANNFVQLNPNDGSIELKRTDGPFIDFADLGTTDFDCRIKEEPKGDAKDFQFYTRSTSSSATRKFAMTGFGSFGVNTVNPVARLSIHHSDINDEGEVIRIGRTDLENIRYHSIRAMHGGNSVNSDNENRNYISFNIHNGTSGNNLPFDGTSNTRQKEALRLTCNTSGNPSVGIGTAVPEDVVTLSNVPSKLAVGIVTAAEIYGTFKGTIDSSVTEVADQITLEDEASDTECFLTFATGATGSQELKTNENIKFNSSDGEVSLASTLRMLGPNNTSTNSCIEFALDGVNDDAHIEFLNDNTQSTNNRGFLRISTSDDSDSNATTSPNEHIEFGDYQQTSKRGNFNRHLKIGRDLFEIYTGPAGNALNTTQVRFTVKDDGSIGIGTTNPVAKLEIHTTGSNANRGLFVTDSNNSNPAPYIRVLGKRGDTNVHQSFSGQLALARLRTNGTARNNQKLGTILFGGNHTNTSESNVRYAASIAGVGEGTFNAVDDMPTGLRFYTGSTGVDVGTNNVSSGTEKMRITAGGDVGIGGVDPLDSGALTGNTSTLAVGIVTANTIFGNLIGGISDTGDVTIDGTLTVEGLTTINDNLVVKQPNNGVLSLVDTQNVVEAGSKIAFFGANRFDAGEEFVSLEGHFTHNNSGSGNKQRGHLHFVIGENSVVHSMTNNGNVGIGSSVPKHKLDVRGNINLNGSALLSSDGGAGNVSGSNIDHIWSDDTNTEAYGQGGIWHFVHDSTYKATGNSMIQVGLVGATNGGHFMGDVGIGTTNPTGINSLTNNTTNLAAGIIHCNTIFGNLVGGITDTGDVSIDGKLDVDGHTDLDNVNIAGVTTFASDIHADVIRSRQFAANSFLDFDDDNIPPHMTGSNVTSLKSISGINLVFDTNNNDNNGLTIGSGNVNSGSMRVDMVVTSGGDVGIGTIDPTGANATLNNTSVLAVGEIKANTFNGTLTGSATQITTVDGSSDTTSNIVFVDSETGAQAPKTGTNLHFDAANGKVSTTSYQTSGSNDRSKYRVWSSDSYAIGMFGGCTYGGLNSHAMTFQMNTTAHRGFWFGDTGHANAGTTNGPATGAMALTTNGKLTVAHSIRVGHGESDTTTPGADCVLEVNGDVGIGTNNPTGANALVDNTTTLAVGTLKANNLTGVAVTAVNLQTTRRTTNAEHFIPYVQSDAAGPIDQTAHTDAGLAFNPNSNILNVGSRVEAGKGSGSTALTTNDGAGNANLTFNHSGKIPDNSDASQSAGRIECAVDSSTAQMYFELGDNTVEDTSVTLSIIMELRTTFAKFHKNIIPNTDSARDIGENTNRFANGYFDTIYATNINGVAGADGFPSGTRMIFQQTNAPTGWTKDTSDVNQRALRVVSGTAGSGGSVDFTTAFASNRSTSGGSVSNHTLTKTQLPAILGRFGIDAFINGVGDFTNPTGSASKFINNTPSNGPPGTTNVATLDIGDATAHNHGFTNPTVNLAVRYLDVIICDKD